VIPNADAALTTCAACDAQRARRLQTDAPVSPRLLRRQ
jgi:hypothetical protein